MNPKTNEYVKLIFSNGLALEGKVISWSDAQGVLESQNKDSKIIINKPNDNILAIKIYNNTRPLSEVKQEVVKGMNSENREDFTKHTLPQLAAEIKAQEMKEFVEPLRSHVITGTQTGNYGIPNFSSQQRSEQRSSEEVRGAFNSNSSSLSNLFKKRK